MQRPSTRLITVGAFTALLVLLVNFSWWFYYDRTEKLLEDQLTRRLGAIAGITALPLIPARVDSLLSGEIDAYIDIASYLDDTRAADSLSELFILDENHRYLVTTLVEPDTVYFLSQLNGRYIDSLFFGHASATLPIVSPTYQTGKLRLKSAFAPLYDSSGVVVAVLGVEADVDYFDSLNSLWNTFITFAAISLLAGILLGFIFISIQKRLNSAEQKLFLTETHAYLGRMVAVVAHELKNPLMIMRASAERLKRKTDAEESGYIIEEVDRLNEIVSGYLDFARSGGSLIKTDQLTSFDFSELSLDLRQHLKDKYAPQEIRWSGEDSPKSLTVTLFRRSLRQVLLNLLINGADACLSAEMPIRVGLRAEVKEKLLSIIVSDNGPGIPSSQIERVFDPFHTTKQDGSGLGLYLCRKIVEEMGGSIVIVSKPGERTDVEINLPLIK